MSEIKNRYESLINKILKVKTKENTFSLLSTLSVILALITVGIIISSIVEFYADGDIEFRTNLYFANIIVLGIIGSLLVIKPLKNIFNNNTLINIEKYSSRIGIHFTHLKDRLLNGVQILKQSELDNTISKDLVYGAFDEVYDNSKSLNFNEIIEHKKYYKTIIISNLIILIGFLSVGINTDINQSFKRIVNYNKSYLPPIPFNLKLADDSQNVLRGENIKLEIIGNGNLPENIDLFLKEGQQGNFDKYIVRKDSNDKYIFRIKSLKNAINYYGKAEYFTQYTKTDTGQVNVIDRPIIRSITGKIIYPSYTGIHSEKFNENNADITALKGSTIDLNVLSNKELDSAFFVFKSINSKILDTLSIYDKDISMDVDSRKASIKYRIKNSGVYKIILKDKYGQANKEPINYRIISMEDSYPSISMIQPRFDVQIDENAILPTKVSISDDFGFKKLILNYKLSYSKYVETDKEFKQIEIPFFADGLSLEIPYVWNLNPSVIAPEDRYQFYYEIFDNDIISGPKSTRTKILTLRLPSLEEAFKEAHIAQNKIEGDLDKVLKEAQKLKSDINKLQNELRKNNKKNKLNWDEKKKAKDISEKQKEIREKMKELSEKLSDNTQKMEKNNLLSQETLEKLKQLQDLMKKVATPEMMQKSKKIQDEMNKMTPEQMQKALEKSKMDDEKMRASIERTLKLLKKMQAEQKTDEIQKRAKELAKQQNELKKETQKSKSDENKNKELSNKQKNIKDDFENLKDEMKSLENMMKDNEDLPKEMFEKAKSELNEKQTQQEMNESKKQLDKGEFKKSQKNQSKAQKKLNEFSNQMQQMKQKMMENENEKMIKEMKQKLSDLLNLSKQQENLKEETSKASNSSTRLPEIQRNQADVQNALKNLANQMSELSKQSMAITPEMGEEIGKALSEMEKSQAELSERRSSKSASAQQKSMTDLNMAASMMQESLSQMQGDGNGSCKNPGGNKPGAEGQGKGNSQGDGMGFSQKLQQAAAQQQMISQSLQQQMQQGQGQGQGKGSQGMGAKQKSEYGRLKDQQGRAKKSVDKMIEEQKRFSNGGDKEKINKLQNISKEMNEVMHDIESGNINPETLKRQEKILSRLLDVNQSVNERDKQKKRQAKSGQNINRKSPVLDLEALKNDKQALNDILKKINQGYSKDYEILIRKYLEEIKDRKN